MTSTIQTGTTSETVIELDILKHGYNILHPKVTDRYDKVIDIGYAFKKIQIKTARVDVRDGNLRVTFEKPYNPSQVDYFAVYAPYNHGIYYIPISVVPPTAKGFTIRITPRRNRRRTNGLDSTTYSRFPF